MRKKEVKLNMVALIPFCKDSETHRFKDYKEFVA
jgi:hypothetical protein